MQSERISEEFNEVRKTKKAQRTVEVPWAKYLFYKNLVQMPDIIYIFLDCSV